MLYKFETSLAAATYDQGLYDEVLALPYPLTNKYTWVELDADCPFAFVKSCRTGREYWLNLADDQDLKDLHACYF